MTFFYVPESTVGTHNDAIRCVDYARDMNAVVTGSWDTYVKVWDVRQKSQVTNAPQSEKVSWLDLVESLHAPWTIRCESCRFWLSKHTIVKFQPQLLTNLEL